MLDTTNNIMTERQTLSAYTTFDVKCILDHKRDE